MLFCTARTSRSSTEVSGNDVAHSLAITSTGIPLIPESERGFSPDPAPHDEESSSLIPYEHANLGQLSGVSRKQASNKESLKKEFDSLHKSHSNCLVDMFWIEYP